MNALTTTQPRQGIFARLRTLIAGSRDPIEAQLADIERQGATLAKVAHLAAGALIILFSIGSLLGLSHSALITLQQQWQTTHTIDLPSALGAAVNAILVVVMDTALLLAASMLRIIRARQGEGGGIHILVMAGVSIIEGATWAYFSWLYDRPTDPVAWGLIAGRAIAAPLLSAYLSLARPIPIGPRDILYQAAMASGKGLIRDITREANDEDAPLQRKAELYRASELMHPSERTRLDQLIAAAGRPDQHQHQQQEDHQHVQPAPTRTHDPIAQIAAPEPLPSPLPFAGRSDHMTSHEKDRPDPSGGTYLVSPGAMRDEVPDHDHRVFTLNLAPKRPGAPAGFSPKTPVTREQIYNSRLRAARRILARTPDLGVRELTRQIAVATQHRISESTAAKLATTIRDELRAQQQQQQRDPDPEPDPAA